MLTRATTANPALLAIKAVGAVVGAQLLITAGDNPDRLRSSASFAAPCGTAPIPVSSGRTDRHRLSRGGDRQANAAQHHIVKNRMTNHPAPARTATSTWPRAGAEGSLSCAPTCRGPRSIRRPGRALRCA